MGPRETKSDEFRRVGDCLYRYDPNGKYYAFIRHQGKLIRRSLKTDHLPQAKRNLADFRNSLGRIDVQAGKTTLAQLCDDYVESLNQASKTMKLKAQMVERIKRDWPHLARAECQVREIRPADVRKWLASYSVGGSAHNSFLWFIRGAFDFAVENRLLAENPAAAIKAKKRDAPIRDTPTFEQFLAIVDSIRAQTHNARSEESADFVEFMGLGGVGNAEAVSLKWGDIDFDAETIILFRQKTRQGYQIPLFPQLRPLLERRKDDRSPDPDDPVFAIKSAKNSLHAACERLQFRPFDHRSLRRMFVTRALQRGVDVKTVAAWQGHRDGGKLILSTYSHVLNDHSVRMARLMTAKELGPSTEA